MRNPEFQILTPPRFLMRTQCMQSIDFMYFHSSYKTTHCTELCDKAATQIHEDKDKVHILPCVSALFTHAVA